MSDDYSQHSVIIDDSGSDDAEKDDYSAHSEKVQTGDKVKAFAQAASGGGLSGLTTTTGMVQGGKIGARRGPWGAAAGMITGGVAGHLVGEETRDFAAKYDLAIESGGIEQLPEELRPAAYAGEVFGVGMAAVTAPYQLMTGGFRPGNSMAGKWVNSVMNMASQQPKQFVATEASMITSSAIFAATAEKMAPGETGIRLGAEISGGFLNPGRYIAAGTRGGVNMVKKFMLGFSEDAQMNEAGKFLRGTLEQYGEDPVLVARMLRESGFIDVSQTAGQKTGSPTLSALSLRLSEKSALHGAHTQKTLEDSYEALRGMIHMLNRTGDPNAVKVAAQVRATHFRTTLSAMVKDAEQTAVDTASKITGDTTVVKAALSKAGHEALGEALSQSRRIESELWGHVNKDLPASADTVVARFTKLRADLLPREKMPDVIEGTINDLKKAKGVTNTGFLIQLRSRSLALAREAGNQGNVNDARIYGQIAEAALDDLDGVFAGTMRGVDNGDIADTYDAARTFSNELNDTFTRSFAGKAMAEGKYGARMPPELMMQKALASGKEVGALQMAELEEATRFLIKQGAPMDDATVGVMLDAQERLLRLAANNTVNPETGKVGTLQLAKFLRDNAELMERFPSVKVDLERALSSEKARKGMENMVKNVSDIIEKRSAFAKLAGGDPVEISIRAINSLDPEKSLKGLIKVARRGGPEAMSGLRTSVFDAAIKKSTPSSGVLDLKQLRAALFEPPVPGRKSVVETMLDQGLMDQDHATELGKLFIAAAKLDISKKPGIAVEVAEDIPGIITDLITRAAGATVATKAAGAAGSQAHGLIIAGRGSSAAQHIFNKLPVKKVQEILIQAMDDPQFAAMLIERTPPGPKQLGKVRNLHAYLVSAGIISTEELKDPENDVTLTPQVGGAQ